MNNKNWVAAKPGDFFIPTVADIIFAMIFLCLTFVCGQGLLADCDTGYHIRAGEYIIRTFSIPHQDIFSFITPPPAWTAHEWLSEVIMAAVHSRYGLTGVVVFFAGLIALVYYLLFRMLRRLNGLVLVSLILLIFAIASSALHWLARPHIFSLLMIVVWYALLDNYQYREQNRLYLCPILMLLWVNLHGGFIVGFVLLGIYGAGNLVLSRFGKETEREAARLRWRLILKITLICVAVSMINPFGYHILIFPFTLSSMKYVMDHIMEFLSPNFHELGILPFKFLLLSILTLLAVSRRRLNIIELVLLLFFVNMALYSVRYITLFAIIITPIAARLADRLMEESGNKVVTWLQLKDAGFAVIDAQARGFFWPLLASLTLPIVLVLNSSIAFNFDEKIKPVAATAFLKREQIPGNMFNNDEFGDYIIYASWPQYRVFIDGRLDMYGEAQFKEYNKIQEFDTDWESIMKKYDMNWVIFGAGSQLSRYLRARNDWHLIYADKVANIFVRNIPLYRPLIHKYPAVKPVPDDPVSKPD